MAKETKLLGRFDDAYPYEVSLVLYAQTDKFIQMTEGEGRAYAGGHFTLVDLLDGVWDAHLECCDVLWLRDLANLEPAACINDVLDELEKRNGD